MFYERHTMPQCASDAQCPNPLQAPANPTYFAGNLAPRIACRIAARFTPPDTPLRRGCLMTIEDRIFSMICCQHSVAPLVETPRKHRTPVDFAIALHWPQVYLMAFLPVPLLLLLLLLDCAGSGETREPKISAVANSAGKPTQESRRRKADAGKPTQESRRRKADAGDFSLNG